MSDVYPMVETLRWSGDWNGELVLLDQTRLPLEHVDRTCADLESVWEAIRSLRVRGAPAIGIAAAYGVCVGVQGIEDADEDGFFFASGHGCQATGGESPHGGEFILGFATDAVLR